MPNRSNNTSPVLLLLLFVASIVGLGAFMAWFVNRFAAQAADMASKAAKSAADQLEWANRQAREAQIDAQMVVQGAMPVGRADVGATEDPTAAWEAQMPWYLQGEGYDPTDDRLPDPQSLNGADRTVLINPGVDLLEFVKSQPTPEGFAMPLPDFSGEVAE